MYDCRVHADGSPGLPDQVVRWEVLTTRLCGMCGDQLGREVAFIATQAQVATRCFPMHGLHVDCARFAFAAVPFYADGQPGRSRAGFSRSEELLLYICPGYEVALADLVRMRVTPASRLDDFAFIRAAPPTRVERHRGWQSMAALLAEEGGCPTHVETVVTGCLEHIDELSPTERLRIGERQHEEHAPVEAVAHLRRAFAPRNLRIQANGFPLTYDNATKPDGEDEALTDMRIERRLAWTRRCLVCADDIGSECAVIGTTLHEASGWFPAGVMHVDCARFSVGACPFLARPDFSRPIAVDPAPDRQHIRTPELVLVIAADYRYSPLRWWWGLKRLTVFARANVGFIKPERVISVERFTGRADMAAFLMRHGGCPPHRDAGITGAPAHARQPGG